MNPQTIQWPEITVGGLKLTLRLSYAAHYQLTRWGKTLADATAVELAAAMAGAFDASGKWKSAGFAAPLDLADLMEQADEAPLIAAVTDAIKKAYPELEVSAQAVPVEAEPEPEPTPTSSTSGLFLVPPAV
jgi:hypothetical protein